MWFSAATAYGSGHSVGSSNGTIHQRQRVCLNLDRCCLVCSSLIPIFWNHLPLVNTVTMGGSSQLVPQVLTLWVQLDDLLEKRCKPGQEVPSPGVSTPGRKRALTLVWWLIQVLRSRLAEDPVSVCGIRCRGGRRCLVDHSAPHSKCG